MQGRDTTLVRGMVIRVIQSWEADVSRGRLNNSILLVVGFQ